MIFVTVGTNEAPFDRLLRAVSELELVEPCIVQIGASNVRPPGAHCVEFLAFDEVAAHIREARLVVCHAGVGSVMVALMNGKRPIVVPRLKRYGEAVDDHQVAFAGRFQQRGLVELVEDPRHLSAAIRADRKRFSSAASGRSRLAEDLRTYLADVIGGAAK